MTNLLREHLIRLSMSLTKMLNSISTNTAPETHLALAFTWTSSHWPQLFESDRPTNSLSTEWSICHSCVFQRQGQCHKLCTGRGSWHHLLFPYPPKLLSCHRRAWNLSGMICPQWSHIGCHQSPPYFPCAPVQIPGGSVPRSCQAQKWHWLACSPPSLPFFPFVKTGYVSLSNVALYVDHELHNVFISVILQGVTFVFLRIVDIFLQQMKGESLSNFLFFFASPVSW